MTNAILSKYVSVWKRDLKNHANAVNPITITRIVLYLSCFCTAYPLEKCIDKRSNCWASTDNDQHADEDEKENDRSEPPFLSLFQEFKQISYKIHNQYLRDKIST